MPTLSSARFEFAGSDNVGVARFECRLDGGGWDSCTSPYGYGGLAVGEHQFEVRAVDTAGNVDPTPAARRWTSITAAQLTVSFLRFTVKPEQLDLPRQPRRTVADDRPHRRSRERPPEPQSLEVGPTAAPPWAATGRA